MTTVLVPSTLLLLPEYAGRVDPVPALRSACREAVAALADGPVTVVTAPAREDNVTRGAEVPAGVRIARHLLVEAGWSGELATDLDGPVLVVANGSACRTEKAPGHLDPRAAGFDETLEKALRGGPADDALALDEALARELWCHDLPVLQWLARATCGAAGGLTHAEATHGVAWWVGSWERP